MSGVLISQQDAVSFFSFQVFLPKASNQGYQFNGNILPASYDRTSDDILHFGHLLHTISFYSGRLTGMNKYGTNFVYSSQLSLYLILHRSISLYVRCTIMHAKNSG
jgi:hypothetical protein